MTDEGCWEKIQPSSGQRDGCTAGHFLDSPCVTLKLTMASVKGPGTQTYKDTWSHGEVQFLPETEP